MRLHNGAADIPKFKENLTRLYGRDDIPVQDLSVDVKRVERSVDLERTALLLFSAAIVAAATVLVGQGLVRSVRAGAAALETLRAMGLSRAELCGGLIAPHLVTLIVAVAVAALTGVVMSARFPIGLARQLDPDLGVHVAAGTYTIALLITAAAVAMGTAAVAPVTTRALATSRPRHTNVVIGAATRAGMPIPAAVGTSLALEQAPSQRASVRPALLAAIVGVVAVVGAATLVSGIDDALHRPARVGTVWDLKALPESEAETVALQNIAPTEEIAGVVVSSRWPSVVGGADAPLYALFGGSGAPIRYVTLRGRAPANDGEVALGARTASILSAQIGDTVPVGPDQLITGSRHRAGELAVLLALGITRRQAAACVSWQATVIGVIALLVGVPTGLIIGRAAWRLTADSLSFVYVGPWSTLVLLWTVPSALIVCWMLSVWPARAAGRRRVAEVLQSE